MLVEYRMCPLDVSGERGRVDASESGDLVLRLGDGKNLDPELGDSNGGERQGFYVRHGEPTVLCQEIDVKCE